MKKYKNFYILKEGLLLTLFFFGVEILFRVVENYSIIDYATLRIFCSCFLISFGLEFILSFIKSRKKRNIVQLLFLLIVTIYAFIESGFRNFLGMYVSVGTSGQMSAVKGYITNFLLSYELKYLLIWIPFFLFLWYMFLKKKDEDKASFSWISRIENVGCIFLFISVFIGTIKLNFMQNPLQLIDNVTLFLVPTNASIFVNQFGIITYGLDDVRHNIFPIHVKNITLEEKEDSDTRLFDDSIWLKVIDEETDPVKNTLNRYFIQRPISEQNDYTGYFEGKNVIVIMMESINNAILDEKYFPYFNKMLKNGWYWENSYSPRNACATGDNEFSGMTSLYPLNTSCTVNVTEDNIYSKAIFSEFGKKKYTTSSYHDLDSIYYKREIFHKNMGSMAYYDGNDLGIDFDSNDYLEWPSDVELVERASEIFTKDTPFMVWMTTVTAHQPYDNESENGDLYFDLFEDTDYSDSVKRYLSKSKVTDDSLGKLMDILEEKGILDDTVIVLYGDHYPYGLSNEDVAQTVDYDIDEFYEIERTPFLIYNSNLEPKVFKEKTFYMNLLPTLANLFDLDYDPRFYLGQDMFSENFEGRVVFHDGSWEDDIARYNASDSSIVYFDESKTYTIDEIKKINNDIYLMKTMSKLAIETNYFDYLEEALKNKQEEEKNE